MNVAAVGTLKSVLPKKTVLLVAPVIIVSLAAILVSWVSTEPNAQRDLVLVKCTGFITNSSGAYSAYVISNRNSYAIKVEAYFVDNRQYLEGPGPAKIILEPGSHTNVTMPIRSKITLDHEFLLEYRKYSVRARLRDYAQTNKLSRWLPDGWTEQSAMLSQNCYLLPQ